MFRTRSVVTIPVTPQPFPTLWKCWYAVVPTLKTEQISFHFIPSLNPYSVPIANKGLFRNRLVEMRNRLVFTWFSSQLLDELVSQHFLLLPRNIFGYLLSTFYLVFFRWLICKSSNPFFFPKLEKIFKVDFR